MKVEQLKRLQSRLKSMVKPEVVKPSLGKSEPVNLWVLGMILIIGVGLFLLLNRRKE